MPLVAVICGPLCGSGRVEGFERLTGQTQGTCRGIRPGAPGDVGSVQRAGREGGVEAEAAPAFALADGLAPADPQRRTTVGQGEGWSGLRFDTALPPGALH